MSRQTRLLLPALLGALLCSTSAQATQIVDLSISQGGWRTSISSYDGDKWLAGDFHPTDGIPAYGNYTDDGTHTLAHHDMTWYCNPWSPACHDDADRDPIAYFAKGFTLSSTDNFGVMRMIADDYMELWVNGHFIFDAILADNKLAGQPYPLEVLISGQNISLWGGHARFASPYVFNDVLNVGTNVIAIKAIDGFYDWPDCSWTGTYPVPGSDGTPSDVCIYANAHGARYLYVHTPEPASLALFGVGGLLVFLRRRKVI